MLSVSRYDLDDAGLKSTLLNALGDTSSLKNVLILPPDFTRFHSMAGRITEILYNELSPRANVDIMPALGTHEKMSHGEWEKMFGTVPYERMITHDARSDTVTVGTVPAEVVRELSEGIMDEPVEAELNRRIVYGGYDLILSVGQVVPHEVVGMANRNKNLFVGCGGMKMINASHMLGAFYGLERVMGLDHTPVRRLYDYAEEHFCASLPICYILTVTTAVGDDVTLNGLFIGRERARFEEAVALSRRMNVINVGKPVKKCVVLLDPDEFRSTWLGNKAIYRTRKMMADGGELIILAGGVKRFAEDPAIDPLIRKYGYIGRGNIIRMLGENADLKENRSAAAHLIHGSSDGRFTITYCTKYLTEEEMRSVGYEWEDFDEAMRKYDPDVLRPGMNDVNGEEVYYVPNPALGLWEAER